jgi:hypothetical protein
MEQQYYIYVINRGWISRMGFSSDVKDSMEFGREAALERAGAFADHEGNAGAIPCPTTDILRVLVK